MCVSSILLWEKSCTNLQLSGSSGLILGDIFGLNAGLTSADDVMLFLFFVLRPGFASTLLPIPVANAGLIGDAAALSIGLCFPYKAAPAEGVLNGVNLGVFRADRRGVSWSPSSKLVSSCGSGGLSNEAAGRARSSNMGGTSGAGAKLGDGWMRINDAGVAGATPCGDCLFRCASIAGEWVAEAGLGGGPISDKGSGEIESVSELSRPRNPS